MAIVYVKEQPELSEETIPLNQGANMGQYFEQLPDKIKRQAKELTKSSGLPDTEESLEKISKSWIEKKSMFEEQIKSLRMVEVETFRKDSSHP